MNQILCWVEQHPQQQKKEKTRDKSFAETEKASPLTAGFVLSAVAILGLFATTTTSDAVAGADPRRDDDHANNNGPRCSLRRSDVIC